MLFDYNYWANERILRQAEKVSPELFIQRFRSAPGLRETLLHTMSAENIWLQRWQGVSPSGWPDSDDFATFEALRTRWAEEEHQMRAFLATLDETTLDRRFQHTRFNGEPRESILWHSMVHVVNHGTQHRAEAALILTEYGHSPGDIDLMFYSWERM
jgi:uncharacterized damage-inducible protein DinB